MPKYLFPQVNWEDIRAVGFDLDGTLYDECEFIVQVYKPIAKLLGEACEVAAEMVYEPMLRRWLKKGSSYNRIFDEIMIRHGVPEERRQVLIKECLSLYRNFEPQLILPERVRILLDDCHKRYELFLITDGTSFLQKKKIAALGLSRWFRQGRVFISGDYGPEFQKPATIILEKIDVLQTVKRRQVVFFGDRSQDERFAANAGFQFIKVQYFAGKSDDGNYEF
jgi:putative hydrolase of the HAD superfamily